MSGAERKVVMPTQEYLEELKNQLENGGLDYLEENSKFTFDCIQCGQCCRNRDDILLSPHDFFHLVKIKAMDPIEFLKKYTDSYIGSSSNLPIVRIKFREEPNGHNTCPFLGQKDGKHYCRVHEGKPNVCRTYPLGRISGFSTDKDCKDRFLEPRYFMQPMNRNEMCQGMRSAVLNHTEQEVLSWVGGREKKDFADRYWYLFSEFTENLSQTINLAELRKLKNEEFIQRFYDMFFGLYYLNYDFSLDDEHFLKRYKENTEGILAYCEICAKHPNGKLKPKLKKGA